MGERVPKFFRRSEKRGADPTAPWGDSTPPVPQMASGPLKSVLVNDETSMRVVTVYTCVSIIADAIATLPLQAFQLDADGIRRRVDPPDLLVSPVSTLTLQDWLTQVMVSMLLRGNAYGVVQSVDEMTGNPTDVMIVPPDVVRVLADDYGRPTYRFGGTPLPTSRVMHIRGLSMPGDLTGMSPISYGRSSIALSKATEEYGANFFQNSAEPSGVITVPGSMTNEATQTLAQSWQAQHQGIANAHLPAVLTGGAQWTPMSISPDDAQFLQTRDYQQREIAMLYRVPQHMLGIQDKTSSWGTGIEQMETGFVINTLRPWLTRVETTLSQMLGNEYIVKFDLSGRLRGDTSQRYLAYQMAITNGWLNVDEVREKEDLPPLPDGLGQQYHTSVQTVPATSPGEPQPAPTVQPDADV